MQVDELVVFLNNYCNFNCYHCYLQDKIGGDLSLDDLKRIVSYWIPSLGVKRLCIIGGEPLLSPRLSAFLELLKGNSPEVIITTNASVYRDDLIESLRKVNFKLLKVSLHSIRAKTFNEFTGTTRQFNNVIKNIEKYAKEFPIGLNITVTRKNYDDVKQIVEFGRSIGVQRFYISQLTVSGNGKNIEYDVLCNEQIEKLKADLEKFIDSETEILRYDDKKSCSWGRTIAVSTKGDFFPCSALTSYQQYSIGNIADSLTDVCNIFKKVSASKKQLCFVEQVKQNL